MILIYRNEKTLPLTSADEVRTVVDKYVEFEVY